MAARGSESRVDQTDDASLFHCFPSEPATARFSLLLILCPALCCAAPEGPVHTRLLRGATPCIRSGCGIQGIMEVLAMGSCLFSSFYNPGHRG